MNRFAFGLMRMPNGTINTAKSSPSEKFNTPRMIIAVPVSSSAAI